ncbi:MAG TPA: YbbC/YhhH family protein [Pyrinomonadaceae bacterium]|nr:YbbC/YhhH family protein [Pyrinomonadaceae bacterium]HMP65640.1 YbbC/YhhH family protein [Pyrinomonadaceae bacterium]
MRNPVIVIILFLCMTVGVDMQKRVECDNFVPDAETAIRVAEAIWLPIYGESVYQKKPFKAELVNDHLWQVTGTLQTQKGGVPYIEIQKCDCKVLRVSHSK